MNPDLSKVFEKLIKSDELMKLLDPNLVLIDDPNDYRYTQIYPYSYDSSIQTEAKSFIYITFDDFRLKDRVFKVGAIVVYIVCHEDLIKLPTGGSRIFSMMKEIDEIFNENISFGIGKLQFKESKELRNIGKYHGYYMVYKNLEFN